MPILVSKLIDLWEADDIYIMWDVLLLGLRYLRSLASLISCAVRLFSSSLEYQRKYSFDGAQVLLALAGVDTGIDIPKGPLADSPDNGVLLVDHFGEVLKPFGFLVLFLHSIITFKVLAGTRYLR